MTRLPQPIHPVYGVGMETPMVQVERTFPTWQVRVDGKVRFSGLWRRVTAEKLAATA